MVYNTNTFSHNLAGKARSAEGSQNALSIPDNPDVSRIEDHRSFSSIATNKIIDYSIKIYFTTTCNFFVIFWLIKHDF